MLIQTLSKYKAKEIVFIQYVIKTYNVLESDLERYLNDFALDWDEIADNLMVDIIDIVYFMKYPYNDYTGDCLYFKDGKFDLKYGYPEDGEAYNEYDLFIINVVRELIDFYNQLPDLEYES